VVLTLRAQITDGRGNLSNEGLLVSQTPKRSVRLAFPTVVAGYLLPDLYPAQL